jgi:hypothetical protein
MCFSGGYRSAPASAPVQLAPPPQINVSAPAMAQSTPAPAQSSDMTSYKKRGKRALTIPQTTSVNVPGA